MSGRTVELSFPADARYLVLARLGLTGIAPLAPLDADALADLKLAVTEACANAIRHAYDDGAGDVRVRIALEEGTLTIEIADDGRGMDATAVDGWHAHELREEGMGFEIMRSVVDEVKVGTGASGGTVVRLLKRL